MKKLSLIFFILILCSSFAFAINIGKDAGSIHKGLRIGGNAGFAFGKQASNDAIYWRTARTDFWNYARTGLWEVPRNSPVATLVHLTYDDNNATSGTAPNPIIYESGATATILDNTGTLAKTGYGFVGWNTAANGSGTEYLPGATFEITEDITLYAQWLAEFVIDLGDIHIAIKDSEAMFFHDSIDFSDYAGTDAGSTPYIAEFEDSAGKKAKAYLGAVGGGEALGSELIVNGDFSSSTGWSAGNSATVSGEVGNLPINASFLRQSATVSVGSIHQCKIDINTISAGDTVNIYFANLAYAKGTFSSTGSKSLYLTPYQAGAAYYSVMKLGSTGAAVVDNMSYKKLTDVPATGLHLMSTKNGTTRNMASVETGFNPNAIIGVTIWTP